MLTQDEKDYLEKISADKKVVIKPYSLELEEIAAKIISRIKATDPTLEIIHLGASSLGISGQGDIDITVLCPKSDFRANKEKISRILGQNIAGISLIEWQIKEDGYDITIYLADPKDPNTSRQLKVQKILENYPDLLQEYEQLKMESAPLGYREYQRCKYEFYNKLLQLKQA